MNETNKYISRLSEQEQKRYRYELSKLDEAQSQELEALVTRMVQAGAKKPLSWAWSEFKEGIPQWARFMIISGMYRSAHDVAGNVDAGSEFARDSQETYTTLVAAAGEEKVNHFLESYARGMLYNMLGILDEGNPDYESKDSWMLITYDSSTEAPGKPISGLHEDFLEFESEIDL